VDTGFSEATLAPVIEMSRAMARKYGAHAVVH
jgi:hypothetical protein